MARIIVYTSFAPAHTYPFVPLLLELRRRRHSVAFVLFTEVKRSVKLAGIPMQQLLWPEPGRVAAGSRAVRSPMGVGVGAAVTDSIRARSPDVVIVDPMLWGAMVAAEASSLPWVSLSHNPVTIRGLKLDVRGPGLPPPRGMLQRLHHQLDSWLFARTQRGLAEVNELRLAYSLPPLQKIDEQYNRAPLTIATTAPPFEYPRDDWSMCYRFVGPLIWEPPQAKQVKLPSPDARPLVVLADTSIPRSSASGSWVPRAIEGLRDTEYNVIATVPEGIAGKLPQNIRAAKFIPHGRLLPAAACVICHGGSGITHKALAAGVPVVAVPDGI